MAQEYLYAKLAATPGSAPPPYAVLISNRSRSVQEAALQIRQHAELRSWDGSLYAFYSDQLLWIGCTGRLDEYLGAESEYSFEFRGGSPSGNRGRRIPFLYLIQARSSTELPSQDELIVHVGNRLPALLSLASTAKSLPVPSEFAAAFSGQGLPQLHQFQKQMSNAQPGLVAAIDKSGTVKMISSPTAGNDFGSTESAGSSFNSSEGQGQRPNVLVLGVAAVAVVLAALAAAVFASSRD